MTTTRRLPSDDHRGGAATCRATAVALACVALCLAPAHARGPDGRSDPAMVVDLAPGEKVTGVTPHDRFVARDDGLYFLGAAPPHGAASSALWRTDGTTDGTVAVHDVGGEWIERELRAFAGGLVWLDCRVECRLTASRPGMAGLRYVSAAGLDVERIVEVADDFLLYTAFDKRVSRHVLFATRGGSSKAVEILDARVASQHTSPYQALGTLGDRIVFAAWTPEHGNEPWVTDGSSAGTRRLADVHEGPESTTLYPSFALDDRVFFFAGGEANRSRLWATDGTARGTGEVMATVFYRDSVRALGALGDRFFFLAQEEGGDDAVWVTDGTASGTRSLPLAAYAGADQGATGVELDGWLYFATKSPSSLWRTDGSVVEPFADVAPATRELAVVGRSVVVADAAGLHAFTTDGSAVTLAEGTAYGLTNYRDELYAVAWGDEGPMLVTDGTLDGTRFFGVWMTPLGSNPSWIREHDDGFVYFRAAGTNWRTDGTAAGTVEADPPPSDPPPPPTPDGDVWFSLVDGWLAITEDGGATWTPLIEVTNAGRHVAGVVQTGETYVAHLTVDADDSSEVWRTDGSPEGTYFVVGDLSSWWNEGCVTDPTCHVRFSTSVVGETAIIASGLVVRSVDSDDTVSTLYESELSVGFVHDLLKLGDRVLWRERHQYGDWRYALWATDGTIEGTERLAESDFWVSGVTPFSGGFFFVYDHPDSGEELWVTDGSVDGTRMVRDVMRGPFSSNPRWTLLWGDRLVFTAADRAHGRELWISDGTRPGTRRVADVWPGARGSHPSSPVVLGEHLYFSAEHPRFGRELWVFDGHSAKLVGDVEPGPGSSNPAHYELTSLGLFFSAWSSDHGRELWRVPGIVAEGTREHR